MSSQPRDLTRDQPGHALPYDGQGGYGTSGPADRDDVVLKTDDPSGASTVVEDVTVLRARTLWLTPELATLPPLYLGLAYGITYPAYESFYDGLGVTPEELGLSIVEAASRFSINMVREVMFILGLVALWRVCRYVAEALGRLSGVVAGTVACVPVLAVFVAVYLMFPSWLATAALWGLLLAGLLMGGGYALVTHRHQVRRAGLLVGAVALLIAAPFYQYMLIAAGQAGRGLALTGDYSTAWYLIIDIRDSPVRLVQTQGDPAHVCTRPADLRLLGERNDTVYLLVRDGVDPRVVRIDTDDYRIVYIDSAATTACESP